MSDSSFRWQGLADSNVARACAGLVLLSAAGRELRVTRADYSDDAAAKLRACGALAIAGGAIATIAALLAAEHLPAARISGSRERLLLSWIMSTALAFLAGERHAVGCAPTAG